MHFPAALVPKRVVRRPEYYSRYQDTETDEFGFNLKTIAEWQPFFQFLYEGYFRVHTLGLENIPKEGRAVMIVEQKDSLEEHLQFLHQAQTALDDHTDALMKVFEADGVQVDGILLEGLPCSEIVKAAADWRADHIMLGSHGDTSVRRSGRGNTAAYVIAHAPCSVDVIKLRREENVCTSHHAT